MFIKFASCALFLMIIVSFAHWNIPVANFWSCIWFLDRFPNWVQIWTKSRILGIIATTLHQFYMKYFVYSIAQVCCTLLSVTTRRCALCCYHWQPQPSTRPRLVNWRIEDQDQSGTSCKLWSSGSNAISFSETFVPWQEVHLRWNIHMVGHWSSSRFVTIYSTSIKPDLFFDIFDNTLAHVKNDKYTHKDKERRKCSCI